MTRPLKIALLYACFAAVATVVNLGSQWLVLWLGAHIADRLPPGAIVVAALVAGTGIGLVVKYILDKRYIFSDITTGAATHARKFSLYSAMGLVTTVIFWGAEFIGLRVDPHGGGLYVGGAVGLAVGYLIKYHLDKTFVFERSIREGHHA